MTYYIKAISIVARNPLKLVRHPKRGQIISEVARRKFRLHWLRDVCR